MNLSASLRRSLRNLFCDDIFYSRALRGGINRDNLNYEKNSLFSKFINVNIYKDKEFFIPILNIRGVIGSICEWVKNSEEKSMEVSYPLYYKKEYIKSTADSIISTFIDDIDDRLCKVTTSKGNSFYGSRGLILDQNWKPLILCGYNMKLSNIAKQSSTLDEIFESINPIVYISPYVFTNTDIISKAILKKIIPFFFDNYINNPGIIRDITNESTHFGVTVEVRNLNNYFNSPIAPTKLSDDLIWSLLDLYKDKICY